MKDDKFTWNIDDPLARCRRETRKANAALHNYALMGSGRSLAKLRQVYIKATPIKPPTKQLRTLAGWSAKYLWQDRVGEWEAIKQAEDEALWDERRRQWCEAEWEEAQKLLSRAQQMLQYPLAEVTRTITEDGKSVLQIVKPVNWKHGDIGRLLEVASKLARMGAGMGTERQEITGAEGGPVVITTIEVVKDYGKEPISDN